MLSYLAKPDVVETLSCCYTLSKTHHMQRTKLMNFDQTIRSKISQFYVEY